MEPVNNFVKDQRDMKNIKQIVNVYCKSKYLNNDNNCYVKTDYYKKWCLILSLAGDIK